MGSAAITELNGGKKCFNVYASSVIEGVCPGRIFKVGPTADLICWDGGCYVLKGLLNQLRPSDWDELGRLLFSEIHHKADQLGLYLDLKRPSDIFEVCEHLKGRAKIDKCITYWSLDNRPQPKSERIVIRNIKSSDLMESSLCKSVMTKWGTAENFFSKGYGVLAEDESNGVLGYCFAGAIGAGCVELSIKVHNDYQNKGIGTKLGYEFLQISKDKDLNPTWTCMESNTSSVKLAERLGFCDKTVSYFLYWTDKTVVNK